MTQAREQPPQLGQLPGSPRAFTGKTGEEFRTSLPDQFRQGIPPELQEEARLKLQDLLEKKTAKAGKAFYDFLVAHVGPHQLDTMLCGTVTGDGCTQIKKLFQTGKIDALLNGDYPISETLRTTLQNAKTRTRTVVANVTVTADETFKLPNIDNFRLGVHLGGEYQTVVTRTRAGTGPATEEYENLFGGELGPFAELDLGPASKARLGGGVGYGQLEGGLFFPVELKVSSSLGTTEGTALFFDVYGKAKIALDPKDFTQLQGGADAYLILFQLGGNQIGIFTSADVMNVKGKSQELTFNITNLQLDLGPQYQVEVNGVLVAGKMGPVFVFPIQGAGEETTYGLHLGTMFQKNIENGKYEFTGGIDISSGNFFSSRVVTGKQDDLPAFTGTLNLGLKF